MLTLIFDILARNAIYANNHTITQVILLAVHQEWALARVAQLRHLLVRDGLAAEDDGGEASAGFGGVALSMAQLSSSSPPRTIGDSPDP